MMERVVLVFSLFAILIAGDVLAQQQSYWSQQQQADITQGFSRVCIYTYPNNVSTI